MECPRCGKVFKSQKTLERHLNKKIPCKSKNDNSKIIKQFVEEVFNNVMAKTKLEEISKIPRNIVYHEDCISGMKKIPSGVADMVICDPPYNIGKDFGNDSDKQEMEQYLKWCDEWMEEGFRVLKPNGTLFIYGFSEILAHIMVRIKYNVRWIVWHYTNKNVPSLNFWQRSHESILCCYKEKPIFNRDDVREPYTDTFLKNAAGKTRKASKGRFSKGEKETTYNAHSGGALPRDIIKVPALAGGAGRKERVNHPTQKPLEICDRLIKSCKNHEIENNLLVVPFAGSGSECVSAYLNGVDYISYELNEDYINVIEERFENLEKEC